jgi:hypothetical protein
LWIPVEFVPLEGSIMGDSCNDYEAFNKLVWSLTPSKHPQPQQLYFVKRLDIIPQLDLLSSEPRRKALILFERALVGKFTGLWPSPKTCGHMGIRALGPKN